MMETVYDAPAAIPREPPGLSATAMRLHPFRALRPTAELAPRVAAPAYDVVSREEATRLAAGNPLSFLHVSRSEIDLPVDVDPHDGRVYAQARENLDRLVADGVLLREPSASLFYRRGRAGPGGWSVAHVRTTVRISSVAAMSTGLTRRMTARHAFAPMPTPAGPPGHQSAHYWMRRICRPSTTSSRSAGAIHRVAVAVPVVDAFGGVACAYVADGASFGQRLAAGASG